MRKLDSVEFVRASCAVYVLACHLVENSSIKYTIWANLFRFGQEAVIAFFLISGFVIACSTGQKMNIGLKEYLSRRWVRIYPIFLLVLVIEAGIFDKFPIMQLLGNISMLQDFSAVKPYVFVSPFLGNGPLWSLSYEWWFYMLFYPMAKFVPPCFQIYILTIAALLATVGYNILHFQPFLFIAYFPIWWAGAAMGFAYTTHRPFPKAVFGSLLSLAAVFIIFAVTSGSYERIGNHPILEVRHTICALGYCCIVMCLWRSTLPLDNKIVHAMRTISIMSYAIYVFHMPIINVAMLTPQSNHTAFKIVLICAAVLLTSYFAEFWYQRAWSSMALKLGLWTRLSRGRSEERIT